MAEFTEEPKYARHIMCDASGAPLPSSMKRHIKLIAEEYYETPLGRFECTNEGNVAMEMALSQNDLGRGAAKFIQVGRPMYDIIRDLNEALKAAGIEAQEYGFSYQEEDFRTAEELVNANRLSYIETDRFVKDAFYEKLRKADHERPLPLDYRWIACYPVTGGSEGYYVHIDLVFQDKYVDGIEEIREAYKYIAKVSCDLADKLNDDWKQCRALNKARDELVTKLRNKFERPGSGGSRKMLALAKTWDWENACDLANGAAQLLGA